METMRLSVRLPREDLEFAKRYAREHGITLTELIDRYLRALQIGSSAVIHPEVERISGLIPVGVDAQEAYSEYLREKHL